MLIFDQLKKNDPQLRLLAVFVFACLMVLLAGLWWVQIVRARDYRASLETQTFRSVRVPSVRGKILDRNGEVLAENRPNYNLSLYLEELSRAFRKEYGRLRPTKVMTNSMPFWKEWLGFSNVKTQRLKLSREQVESLGWQARYNTVSNVTQQISAVLGQPLSLDTNKFKRHYEARRALPYPLLTDLTHAQVARLEEHYPGTPAADLEVLSTRIYPHGTVASHLLGYVVRDDSSVEGEEAYFSYRLPDYRGAVGIEGGLDAQLRGRAGAKSVVVNSLGYRQTDEVWAAAEPGRNVTLTIDLRIQRAAEAALKIAGSQVQGAVVVMDVNKGDVLALVSSPATDPNNFINGFSPLEYARWTNEVVQMQRNRATQMHYQPGSIFKTIVGLACLEVGLDPNEKYEVQPNPRRTDRGIIFVGRDRKAFRDTVTPGLYDFTRATAKSCNSYFITNGLRFGVEKIVELGQRLHLGERMGLPTKQEAAGNFPTMKRVNAHWRPGDTALLCIGQGAIDVTPLQMAVMTSALANGGKVLWPRLVARIETANPATTEPPQIFTAGRVRDHLGVSERSLKILKDAMLADTEHPEGTAYGAFRAFGYGSGPARSMRVCGKTGTAQVEDARGNVVDNTTWFISFAPYESPRYAVVVMVESGGSGGGTCAPVAREIYTAIQQIEAANKTLVGTP